MYKQLLYHVLHAELNNNPKKLNLAIYLSTEPAEADADPSNFESWSYLKTRVCQIPILKNKKENSKEVLKKTIPPDSDIMNPFEFEVLDDSWSQSSPSNRRSRVKMYFLSATGLLKTQILAKALGGNFIQSLHKKTQILVSEFKVRAQLPAPKRSTSKNSCLMLNLKNLRSEDHFSSSSE